MWRRTTVANVVTLNDTEVWEYSLPTTGVLNAVLLQLRATNGGTSNLGAALEQCVSAIQVVDGGRVLMDLSGSQGQIVSLLGSKVEPRSVISEILSNVQTYQALLPLGMKLFDDEVGLDLSKLRSPKLRVDFDLTAVRAAGATGFLTGTGRLSCVLIVNDGSDVPSPSRFLKSHEIKRWTTAASGDEITQGPIDGPWARLIARAHVTNVNPDAVLTDLKVTFDSGRYVAIDELTRWAADSFGPFMGRVPRFAFTAFKADTETFDTRHGSIDSFSVNSLLDTNIVDLAGFEAGRPTINLNVSGAGTTQATEDSVYLTVWAHNPYKCMVWDFVPQGLLDVAPYSRGDIVCTQGTAAAAASLVLQQLMENKEA